MTDFCVSYDGDENASSAPVAVASAPAAVQPGPPATTQTSNGDSTIPTDELDTPYKPLPFENDVGNQAQALNGNSTSNYEHNQNTEDVTMDHEPFGSGIKEDG